jgi:transposase
LLDRTREALDKIVARKKKGSTEKLSAQLGKILARYKMGKFVEWKIRAGRLKWNFKEAHIKQEKLFDGCYIVSATVPQEQMNHQEVVGTYKNLSVVEQAFRNLKTVSLEIRPVYHKKDPRICSHVFLCVLAFYLQWHMQQRLKPLFEEDGQGKNRQWTVENVIQRLMAIRKERVKVADVEFDQVSQADEEQQKILDLLKVKL